MTTASRPGGECCARCHGLFGYAEMRKVTVHGWKRPRWMCRPCRTHLAELRMLVR